MKIKLSWIPFIPAALAMVALRLLSVFGNDDTGTISGMNALLFSYLAVGVALVLFVLCIFFNILDKKTAPVYESKRNVPAGIFAVLSAAFALAYSVMTILTRKDSEYLLMSIICAFLAMLAAIGLVFMARTHFTGFAPVSNIAFLYIFPTLWAVSELISCFLEATKLSVSASDMSLLFCFIFLTLSLFPQAMVISKIPGRNPVKATFIYGLPSVAFGLSYGAFLIARVIFDSADGMALIAGVMFISFALYQLFYIIELTRGALKKDDVQIVDAFTDDDDTADNSGKSDELVFSDEEKKDEDYAQNATADTDDFIMGYEADDDVPNISAHKVIGNKNSEDDITGGFFFGVGADDDDDDSSHSILETRRQKKEEKLMGEIDKLLAELDEQQQELNDKK